MPLKSRQDRWAGLGTAPRVRVELAEQLHSLDVPILGGKADWCPVLAVDGIDLGGGTDEAAHHQCTFAACGGGHEARPARGVRLVRFAPHKAHRHAQTHRAPHPGLLLLLFANAPLQKANVLSGPLPQTKAGDVVEPALVVLKAVSEAHYS